MKAFDATRFYFDRAADQMDLSDNMRRLLIVPKREIQVQVPVERDNGEIHTYIGYRVQHDNSRGPMKGGPAVPSRGRSRRSPLAGRPDDLEDGRREPALRRRERGHLARSQEAQRSASWR